MATWLRQSTAVDIAFGPFLDETDGKTAETALTITQADIRLKKNGGAWGQKNAAQTLSHEENGWYEISLDTTDTNTTGILIVAVHEAGALPVWREFLVVPQDVYDAYVTNGLGPVADAIMQRASSNWETGAAVKSLGTAVMKAVHKTEDAAGTLNIYRSNGTTVHASQTITTDNNNLPIDSLSGAS